MCGFLSRLLLEFALIGKKVFFFASSSSFVNVRGYLNSNFCTSPLRRAKVAFPKMQKHFYESNNYNNSRYFGLSLEFCAEIKARILWAILAKKERRREKEREKEERKNERQTDRQKAGRKQRSWPKELDWLNLDNALCAILEQLLVPVYSYMQQQYVG